MINWRHIGAFFLCIVLIWSCKNEEPQKEKPIYTFAAAGHVYGNPDTYTSSVYPPFLVELDSLFETSTMDMLVLTGDVVAHPTEENWETVRHELDSLPIDRWVIAPGNHDISPYMDQHIQSEKYMAFREGQSLFLILNTSHPGWSVDSLQSVFIKQEIEKADSAKNIFVFSHQLWWEKDPPAAFDLDSLRPNSFALYDGEKSFWTEAFSHFENLEQEVYFFAGDMGCHYSLPGYYEDHYENFHFYGSGMGGAVEDNFLFVEVFQNDSVYIHRVDF